MKKMKFVLLTLVSLSLVGCGGSTSSVNAPTSENPIGDTDSVAATLSEPAASSADPTSSVPVESSLGEEGTSSEEESPVSSSIDPYSIGWSRTITDKMLRYLCGHVIPYVSIGKSKSTYCDYTVSDTDTGVLSISGTDDWDATSSTKFSAAFSGSEWSIETSSSSQFKAVDDTDHLTVIAKADEGGSVCIYVTYDEPYDVNAASDWPDDVKTEFTTDLGDVPAYVYLATANPTASKIYSSDEYVTVYGGKWNDQVLSDAETDLSASGYIVTKTSDSLTAKGTAANGKDQFRIEISSYTGYGTGAVKKVRAKIYLEEAFDPTAATAWPTDVATDISTNLDGHDLPFVYLGTKTPTSYWYSYYSYLEITGGNWDDQILDLAATAYPISDTCVVTRDDTAKTFKAVITESDSCVITLEIGKDSYSGKAELQASITKAYVVPAGADWTQDTKDLMTANFNGKILPYVYLNTTSETSSWNSTTSTLTIDGSDWDDGILSAAQTAFDNDTAKADTDTTKVANWTVTIGYRYTYDSYQSCMVKGTATDGGSFDIVISRSYSYTSYSYVAEMEVQYKPKYEVPAGVTNWDSDTLQAITDNLHGHTIPFVYLNTQTPSSSWYSYSNELDITGGIFDDAMLTAAQTNFTAAGWSDVTIADQGTYDYSDVFSASHTFNAEGEDGCTVSVELKETYSGTVRMELTLSEAFNSSLATDWTDATKTEMTTRYGKNLPFVYLGTKSETLYTSSSKYLEIDGGTWDDQIITNATATYSAAGYTCAQSKNSYGKTFIAYKTDETTYKTYTVLIEKNYNGKPEMYIFSDTGAAIPDTSTAWPSTVTSAFSTYTGNNTNVTLPYLYLGTGTPASSTSSYYNQFTITSGGSASTYYIIKAIDTLKADGKGDNAWNLSLTSNSYGLVVSGTKVNRDNSKLSLTLGHDYSGNNVLTLTYNKPFVSATNATDWSSSVLTQMKSKFSGHTIPYFYMGSDTPSVSDYSNELDLRGDTWDDLIFTNAQNAFNNEKDENGKSYWTVLYDYSSDAKMIATRDFDDGSHFTVKIYQNYSGYPLVEIYYR